MVVKIIIELDEEFIDWFYLLYSFFEVEKWNIQMLKWRY
jgi:hypothetical protein